MVEEDGAGRYVPSGQGRAREASGPVERGLVALAALAATALALELLIGWALTGAATGLDPGILVWTRSATGSGGPLVALAKGITAFGNDVTLWTVTILAAGYLFALRHRAAALHLIAVASSGGLLTATVKLLVHRPRPAIVQHLVEVQPPSFPSGHATDSAFVYGTLALIAVRTTGSPAGRRYLALVLVSMVLLVGASRVVLGVHWPSDVLAGWTVGALWAVLGGRVAASLGLVPSERWHGGVRVTAPAGS